MISLSRMSDLFRDDAPIPKDSLKHDVLKDFKNTELIGVAPNKLDISFHENEGSDILVRVVDPQTASGYLVFKDETEYNNWMAQSLYEPSQDEIQEASSGSGTD